MRRDIFQFVSDDNVFFIIIIIQPSFILFFYRIILLQDDSYIKKYKFFTINDLDEYLKKKNSSKK